MSSYDVIILGGGPAGYTAALYAARAGLSALVVEKLCAGGQMAQTDRIDNYPGFPEGIDGFTLAERMRSGAQRFGAETIYAEVFFAALTGREKTVVTGAGTFSAGTVIIATGAEHRHLGLEREAELAGKGISYCPLCDGMFFRGKTVAVVGGGNSAAAAAALLSRIAEKVYLIHRGTALRAEKAYQDSLSRAENLEFLWSTTVSRLEGSDALTGVILRDVSSGNAHTLALDGLFICVGQAPATSLFRGQLELDEAGYIVAGESGCTSLPGVYAAGDVRAKPLRQIATAVADGANAAHSAESYLRSSQ